MRYSWVFTAFTAAICAAPNDVGRLVNGVYPSPSLKMLAHSKSCQQTWFNNRMEARTIFFRMNPRRDKLTTHLPGGTFDFSPGDGIV